MQLVTILFWIGIASVFSCRLAIGQTSNAQPASSENLINQRDQTGVADEIDPILLAKVRPLFPSITLRPNGKDPFFSTVRQVASVTLKDGKKRLVVAILWKVPAAMVDHGGGQILIFDDGMNIVSLLQLPTFTLPFYDLSKIHLVDDRWLQFGDSPLLDLTEEKSLNYVRKYGMQVLFYKISLESVRKALTVYLTNGLGPFLKMAPVAKKQELFVKHLPQRINRVEIYPSLVEDFSDSGFRYSSNCKGAMLVRLTPNDKSQKPINLTMRVQIGAGGFDVADVKLFLLDMKYAKPTDRPMPYNINDTSVK